MLWHKGISSCVFFAANVPAKIAVLNIEPLGLSSETIFLKVLELNFTMATARASRDVDFFLKYLPFEHLSYFLND